MRSVDRSWVLHAPESVCRGTPPNQLVGLRSEWYDRLVTVHFRRPVAAALKPAIGAHSWYRTPVLEFLQGTGGPSLRWSSRHTSPSTSVNIKSRAIHRLQSQEGWMFQCMTDARVDWWNTRLQALQFQTYCRKNNVYTSIVSYDEFCYFDCLQCIWRKTPPVYKFGQWMKQ